MAGPNLQINIGASVASAVQGLNQVGGAANTAAAGLNSTGRGAAAAGRGLAAIPPATGPAGQGLGSVAAAAAAAARGLNALSPAIRPNLQGLTFLAPAANNASAALNRTRGNVAGANAALTDLGRVVQDAPFGIVGIANNITQLSDSFTRLRLQTGSTGAALRALGGSLLGPGGLGIAISLITTALTLATVGFGAWTRGFGGGKSKIDEITKSTEELVKGIKSVSQVTAESTGSVQGQVAQVQALSRVVTDTNKAYDIRKRALSELQQINKEYFGTLKLEDAATGALTSKVNEYTKALVAQAVVKGFTDEITRLSKELFTQQQVVEKSRTSLNRLERQLANTPRLQSNAQGVASQSAAYSKLVSQVEDARKEFLLQRDAQEKLATAQVVFISGLQKANEESLKFADTQVTGAKGSKKTEDALKNQIEALEKLEKALQEVGKDATDTSEKLIGLRIKLVLRDGAKEGLTPSEIQQQVSALQKQLQEVFTKQAIRFEVKAKPSLVGFEKADLPKNAESEIAKATGLDKKLPPINIRDIKIRLQGIEFVIEKERMIKQAEAIEKVLADALVPSITGAADSIGQAFGEILSGGDAGEALRSAAEGILGIIGGVLQEVGKQIIATSTLVAALKKAISGLFGPGGTSIAFGVGLALVALGGLLKNIKIPGFATGVTNFSGGLAMVGEAGRELVRLPAGSDVIPNHRVGDFLGGQSFIASTTIRGDDIKISYDRTTDRKRRI